MVGPRLVLTAAHILGDDGAVPRRGAITVCRSGSLSGEPDRAMEREFPATVRWYRKDDDVDAALVEVDDTDGWSVPESLQDTGTRSPQRWGRLIGTRPHLVSLFGYPRMYRESGSGPRRGCQLHGCISPTSDYLAGRYEITSTDPTLKPDLEPDSPLTRWSGMSGAAVLADSPDGALLCGVTRYDLKADGGTILTATPTSKLLAAPGFRAALTCHTGWTPILEPAEPAHLLAPAARRRDLRSPAMLLRADAEAVDFRGRDSELKRLRAWCETGPGALSVQAVTGPGGQGKTRLARRLADLLAEADFAGQQEWVTGQVDSRLTDHDMHTDFTSLDTALHLLLVVDYAETRPQLLHRLIQHLQASRHKVRVLLLARSDGPWRKDAYSTNATAHEILNAAVVSELAPLLPAAPTPLARTRAFTDAVTGLARLLPLVPDMPAYDWGALAAAVQAPDDIRSPRYDNILTLQMTALTTLLQDGPAPVTITSAKDTEEVLLWHEARYWERSAGTPAFKLDALTAKTLAHAVAVAAVCGAATGEEARTVTRTIREIPETQIGTTTEWLAALYPPGVGRYWGSLLPDRVAEYHASTVLTGDDTPLPALMKAAAPDQQAQLIIVLARAAVAHFNARRNPASHQVLDDLNTALDTITLHRRVLESALAALPSTSHVLASLAARLAGDLAAAQRNRAQEELALLARSLSDLGDWLSRAGRRAEALETTAEAAATYRRLANPETGNPATYEPALALSLYNLGVCLSEEGRRAEALEVAAEAVAIYRRLAHPDTGNPAAHEPGLARSLANLSIGLTAAGRRAETLDVNAEAAAIYRRLAHPDTSDPAAHEPDFAASLTNLGHGLSDAGRHTEAMEVAAEGVATYRRLADPDTGDPATHEPNLARSLTNLSSYLLAAGRQAEALDVATEAVAICRRLADPDTGNPAAHEPDLAHSLYNLGADLSAAGRRAEALEASAEAVAILRRLADPVSGNPAAHEPDLALSLYNLAADLSAARRWREALEASAEAVEIYRTLIAAEPAGFISMLRRVLKLQAGALLGLGRLQDAQVVRDWLAANPEDPDSHK
ncbi:tetratricopeptide repeat protein [Streptomyces sp. NPDC019531]|uniref:tetratricopeptide repeat protein n=1 Tax=Streptomyces sp. NPDC019531 TaxID=3365062 RepID=UPI00384C537B